MCVMLKAYWLGLKDGFKDGQWFGMGKTWDDGNKNEAYDSGVNTGQRIARLFRR